MSARKNDTAKNDILSMNIRKRSEYAQRMDRAKHIVYLVLAASLVVFLVIAALAIINEGIGKFVQIVESINLFYYLAAFLVLFIGYLLDFPKWQRYIHALKIKISRWDSFVIYFSMFSMDITPGRWGRAVVSYTINRVTRVKFTRIFPAVVADIFTDFIGFAILTLVSAFFVGKYFIPSLLITLVLLLPFIFLFVERPFRFVKRKLERFRGLRSFLEAGELYFEENKRLRGRDYIYSIAFTLPSVIFNGLALYLVILAFGIHIGLSYLPIVMFVYSSSLLFGIVTGVPGTLGVTDAALVSYLSLFFSGLGVTFGIAAAITIFFRIVSVWFVEGFGFTALFYSLRRWDLAKA